MPKLLAIDELRKGLVRSAAVVDAAQRMVDGLLKALRELGFLEMPSFGFHYSAAGTGTWHTNTGRQLVYDPATERTLALEVRMSTGWDASCDREMFNQWVELRADGADTAMAAVACFDMPLPLDWAHILVPGQLAASVQGMAAAVEQLSVFSDRSARDQAQTRLLGLVQAATP